MENSFQEWTPTSNEAIYERSKQMLLMFRKCITENMHITLDETPKKVYPRTVSQFFKRIDSHKFHELFNNVFDFQVINMICLFLERIAKVLHYLNRALQPTTIFNTNLEVYNYSVEFDRLFGEEDVERYKKNGANAANYEAKGHKAVVYQPLGTHKKKQTLKLRGYLNDQEIAFNDSIKGSLRADVMNLYLPKLLRYLCECCLNTNCKSISFFDYFHNESIIPPLVQQSDHYDDKLFIEQLMTSIQLLIGAFHLKDMYLCWSNHKREIKVNQVKQSVDIVDQMNPNDIEEYLSMQNFHGLMNAQQSGLLSHTDTVSLSLVTDESSVDGEVDTAHIFEKDNDGFDSNKNIIHSSQPLNLTSLCIVESSNGIRNGLGRHEHGSGVNSILQVCYVDFFPYNDF
jgi:hypothetical protein